MPWDSSQPCICREGGGGEGRMVEKEDGMEDMVS